MPDNGIQYGLSQKEKAAAISDHRPTDMNPSPTEGTPETQEVIMSSRTHSISQHVGQNGRTKTTDSVKDLLAETIANKDGPVEVIGTTDFGTTSGPVEVVFRNIERRIVEVLGEYDAAYGCVAWLTNRPILEALARKKDVTVIVQKEDFLRPDTGGPDKEELRALYRRLNVAPSVRETYQFSYNFSSAIGNSLDAVRCVGYAPDKYRTTPKMHNKFMVLCRTEDVSGAGHRIMVPAAVITGSFNMTSNATRSLENIVIVRDFKIAMAYLSEFETIFGISEPLNWQHEYVAPRYSDQWPMAPEIGT